MIFAVVDDATRRHLLAAVSAHLATLRRDAVPVPAGLRELVAALAVDGPQVARGGQSRPTFDPELSDADDHLMDVLTLDYRAAGVRLGVSDRSVRRLVRDGALPVVEVAGCRRIRSSDLRDHVAALPVVNRGDTQTAAGEAETP